MPDPCPPPDLSPLALLRVRLRRIGGFLGQLPDAVVGQPHRAVDVITERLLDGPFVLGETIQDGTQLIQQLQGGLGFHRATIAKADGDAT